MSSDESFEVYYYISIWSDVMFFCLSLSSYLLSVIIVSLLSLLRR